MLKARWRNPGLSSAFFLSLCAAGAPSAARAQTASPAPESPPSAPESGRVQTTQDPPHGEPSGGGRVSNDAKTAADAVAAARLESTMAYYREQMQSYRVWAPLGGAAIAAAAIPAGVVLFDKGQPFAGGIALGTGIGVAAGALLVALSSGSPMGSVGDAFYEARKRGESDAAVVEAAERAWKKQADEARRGRRVGGPILSIVGAAALGTGVWFAVTPDRIGNLSSGEQAGIGAALIFGGSLGVLSGLQHICFATPVESSWEEYKRHTGRAGVGLQPRKADVTPRLAVVPTQGGAYASAALSF